MKSVAKMTESEYKDTVRDMRQRAAGGRNTLGFYIQLMFIAGAAVTIATNGAWKILWGLLAFLGVMIISSIRTFSWKWTEDKLQKDAEAGRIKRAIFWDYICLFFDWLISFAGFVVVAFTVFGAASGYNVSRPLLWVCVGAMHTLPFTFRREKPGYNYGNYLFWVQWTLIATIVASAFIPFGVGWGVAAQVAIALVSIPLGCRFKKADIVEKVQIYYRNATVARATHTAPLHNPTQPYAVEVMKATLSDIRVAWVPFTVSFLSLATGVVWMIVLKKPWPLLVALPAIVLGYVLMLTLDSPLTSEPEELTKRGVDKDLVRGSVELRALMLSASLAIASSTIMWFGGRDAALLVPLSLLALGACCVFDYVVFEGQAIADPLLLVAFAAAFASTCALRIAGLPWWQCLMLIPTIGYALPAFRYLFPRSGLRGEARKAALAVAAEFAADSRTEEEKARDEKLAKRRAREERRIANFRRSRRG
ncbi:MAG: hypothetical protein IKU71_01145 [Kiritimatiellae bacterium]|nr:hypothetical protein [Kiritimatiellia bacterium]